MNYPMGNTIIGAEVAVFVMVTVAAILAVLAGVKRRSFRLLFALAIAVVAGLMMASLQWYLSPTVWMGFVTVVSIPLVIGVARLLVGR